MGVLTTLIRSITGYVQGIITSKQNLRTSIIGKEVDVPESAKLSEYPSYVDKIKTDGIDTTDATATSSDMRDGVMAYANDKPVYGNLPTRTASDIDIDGGTVRFPAGIYDANEEATIPEGVLGMDGKDLAFSLDESSGKLTVGCPYSGGYSEETVLYDDYQLPTVDGQTFVPGNKEQTIVPAGKYTKGDIKIAAVNQTFTELGRGNSWGVYVFGAKGAIIRGYTTSATESTYKTGLPDRFFMALVPNTGLPKLGDASDTLAYVLTEVVKNEGDDFWTIVYDSITQLAKVNGDSSLGGISALGYKLGTLKAVSNAGAYISRMDGEPAYLMELNEQISNTAFHYVSQSSEGTTDYSYKFFTYGING